MAELAELEQEELEESMASMGPLPSVPSSRLPSQPSRRGSKCNNAGTLKQRFHCMSDLCKSVEHQFWIYFYETEDSLLVKQQK